MHVEMNVSLDPTLGCGQAHRWRKIADCWEGVLGKEIITLEQTEDGFNCTGTYDRSMILNYFRNDDNITEIIEHISKCDPYVAKLSNACPGLRILRQEKWECLATYLLATNVNVKRIAKMVESVCDNFGDDLGERRAFPTPKQILDGCDRICECKLGFREKRFIRLAERMENEEIDLERISEMDYEGCVKSLMDIDGVGPKVADCVALFAFDHTNAFPVDARISASMEKLYGVTGNYKVVSEYGRQKFGKYAGYAQEFLYHSDHISM
ncbi:MAG: hypothetical protein KRP56_00195 [Candidatus Methanogranum gryphiswaldense]|nr:MAG: hypothetical protein KRP56_00195 [Candidatus Methanogranum sp. U3.2.1]